MTADLVAELCQRWNLELDDGEPTSGYLSTVVPVLRADAPCALKLTSPEDAELECVALAAWSGRGSVRLLESAPERGALLLERLDASRTLADVEILGAARIAGGLLRRLAIPAPQTMPSLHDRATDLATSIPERQRRLGDPIPVVWIDEAVELARQLSSRRGDRLVHGDLHYGNVLAGEREPWLAIDPKPIAGDLEYGVPELMWTRVDEVADADIGRLMEAVVESAELDRELARRWIVVRCVDYWLWGLPNGLTVDPERCRRVLSALTTGSS